MIIRVFFWMTLVTMNVIAFVIVNHDIEEVAPHYHG